MNVVPTPYKKYEREHEKKMVTSGVGAKMDPMEAIKRLMKNLRTSNYVMGYIKFSGGGGLVVTFSSLKCRREKVHLVFKSEKL